MSAFPKIFKDEDVHKAVLEKLMARLQNAENAQANFTNRWTENEKRHTAYVNYDRLEAKAASQGAQGRPPKASFFIIPYSFAAAYTAVTFFVDAFLSQRPFFAVGTESSNAGAQAKARNLETILQYQADRTGYMLEFINFCLHAMIYGVGNLRTEWKRDIRRGRVVHESAANQPPTIQSAQQVVYEGNAVRCIDPYSYFPDPRVPMHRVAKEGEFTFWRSFESRLTIRTNPEYTFPHGVIIPDAIPDGSAGAAAIRFMGIQHPGSNSSSNWGYNSVGNFAQLDQCAVKLIPSEWNLKAPEGYKDNELITVLFTVMNKSRIIQAELLDYDHGMLPVVSTEPYSIGTTYGTVALADITASFQDFMSWLVNSRAENVRRIVSHSKILINPAIVEENDFMKPEQVLVRLKDAAFGTAPRDAVFQLPLTDVTQTHNSDILMVMRIAEMLIGFSSIHMGQPMPTGRRSATETRSVTQGAGQRLALLAKIISSQAISLLAEQWGSNVQQFLRTQLDISVPMGTQRTATFQGGPENFIGNFHYPTFDGTVPPDKLALLSIWKEIFSLVQSDPELRQQYPLGSMFEYIATLGGVKDIGKFKAQVVPDEQAMRMLQSGQIGPVGAGEGGNPLMGAFR